MYKIKDLMHKLRYFSQIRNVLLIILVILSVIVSLTLPSNSSLSQQNIFSENSPITWKILGDNSLKDRILYINQSNNGLTITFGGIFSRAEEIIFKDPLNETLNAWINIFSKNTVSEISKDESLQYTYHSKSSYDEYAYIKKPVLFYDTESTYMISFDYKLLAASSDTMIFAFLDSFGNALAYLRFPWGNVNSNYLDFAWTLPGTSIFVDNGAKINADFSLGNWYSIDITFEERSSNLIFKVSINNLLYLKVTTTLKLHDIRAVAIGSMAPNQEARFKNFEIKRLGQNSTEIYVLAVFQKEIDISSYQYLSFKLFADSSVGSFSPYSPYHATFNYTFGVYLYDSNGNWKGWDGYVINWVGWKQIVIPIKGTGWLVENTFTGPNDVSPEWNDAISLKHITGIRFDLNLADPNDPTKRDLALHMLTVTDIQLRNIFYNNNDFVKIFIYIITILFFISIFIAKRMKRITDFLLNAPHLEIKEYNKGFRYFVAFVLSAFAFKSILATFTPLSSDFIDIVYGATPVFPWSNVLNNSPTQGGWWFLILFLIYNFWLALPITHLSILDIFPGNYWNPMVQHSLWSFANTPSSYLLVFMLKLPNVITDIAIGLYSYLIVGKLTGSIKLAQKMLVVWLLNPFSILIAEMWGSLDIIVIGFMVLSLVALLKEKFILSGILLGLSIGIRTFAVLFLPFILLYVWRLSGQVSKGIFKKYMFALVSASIISLIPYMVAEFILSVPSKAFVQRLPDYSFLLGVSLDIPGFQSRYVTIILYFLLLLFGLMIKKMDFGKLISLLAGVSLAIFAFSRWQPHWLIYLVYFLLLEYYSLNRQTPRTFLVLLLGLLGATLVPTSAYFMSWGNSIFFIPIDDSLKPISINLANLNSYIESYTTSVIGVSFQGMITSAFTAVAIFILILIILRLKNISSKSE